jgi:hypothetical protein
MSSAWGHPQSVTLDWIDFLVRDIPNARSGFRLLFSAAPFPGYRKRLVWQREEFGGNWYACDDPPMGFRRIQAGRLVRFGASLAVCLPSMKREHPATFDVTGCCQSIEVL